MLHKRHLVLCLTFWVHFIAAQADMKVAGVSPAGDYILLTTGSNQGLQRYDLESQTLTTLSEAAGAGYNVQVSNDGKEVVYRETSLNRSNLRESKFVRMNMYNERRNTIARGQRDMKHMSITYRNTPEHEKNISTLFHTNLSN